MGHLVENKISDNNIVDKKMEYGVIGKVLAHSFSKPVHESLADYTYNICELPDKAAFDAFFEERSFKAINVTIPYKADVIPLCAYVDPKAAAIGAVNTIVNRDGELYGYNTDYMGFLYLTDLAGVDFAGKKVMVLGTGGTCKTVCTAALDRGAVSAQVVGRKAAGEVIDYAAAATKTDTQIIINTTPVGMYPNNDACPIDIDFYVEAFPKLEAVIDVVYNPLESVLVQKAKAKGLIAMGGLPMLVAQAKFAVEIFLDKELLDSESLRVLSEVKRKLTNVVLVGMPSCGKSRKGEGLAERLGRKFVDLDAEIVAFAGKSIPEIFAEDGEEKFREIESLVCKNVAKENGLVIATGGGIVKNPANVLWLKQNAVVAYVKRDLDKLKIGGNRPLSTDMAALEQLFVERNPLYEASADFCVTADEIDTAVDELEAKFNEVFSY